MKEKTIIHFIKQNIWTLVASLFCLGALLFFLDQRGFTSKKTSAKEFIAAKVLFDRIYTSECLSKESLETACEMVNKHPALAKQYQGVLSLALAQGGFAQASESYTKSHLSRLDSISTSYHKNFAETGFLISQGQYDLSLKQALSLEDALQKEPSYPRLRAFNLMRIAFLGRETNQEDITDKTISEVSVSPFFSEIQFLFSENSFTLKDFFR